MLKFYVGSPVRNIAPVASLSTVVCDMLWNGLTKEVPIKAFIAHLLSFFGSCGNARSLRGGVCIRHRFHWGKHQSFNGEQW